MQFSWRQIEFATCGVHFLPAVIGVALIAFAFRSRAVFVVGITGAVLGWLLTGSLLPLGRSTGGPVDNIELAAESVLINSLLCSAVSLVVLVIAAAIRFALVGPAHEPQSPASVPDRLEL